MLATEARPLLALEDQDLVCVQVRRRFNGPGFAREIEPLHSFALHCRAVASATKQRLSEPTAMDKIKILLEQDAVRLQWRKHLAPFVRQAVHGRFDIFRIRQELES